MEMKCRLCLFECSDKEAFLLFQNNEETNWTKLIAKYLFIEVKETEFSTIICKDCSKILEDFHIFFQKIENQQKLLQTELKLIAAPVETEESLLDVKYLVPENVTTSIENPLSPEVDNGVANLIDDNGESEENVNGVQATVAALKNTTVKSKRGVKKRKKSNSTQSIKRCSRVSAVKTIAENSSVQNVGESTSENNQNPTIKEQTLGDELISKYLQLKCELCGEILDTFRNLKTHFRKEHASDGFVMCCEKRFRLRSLLLDHIQTHLDPDHLKCEICSKVLMSRERLKLHKATKHSDRQELKSSCTICHKRFACTSSLNSHMFVHSKERNHICDICNKGFKTKLILKAHMRSHKETNPFVCETCGREYRNKPSFERHVEEHKGHVKKPTRQCTTCGKYFTNDGLQRHISSHILEDVECKICGKIVKSKNALRGHMDYAHRRQQTLVCAFCEKTFKRPSVYKEHIAMHTGQKDYNCPHCPREFRSKANMYAHVKKVHITEWAEAQLARFKGPNEQTEKANEMIKKIKNLLK